VHCNNPAVLVSPYADTADNLLLLLSPPCFLPLLLFFP
jgi:hypothetical protein